MTVLFVAQVHSNDYNITFYTRSLPEELKSTVRLALRAEYQPPNNKTQSCDSSDSIPCPPSKYRNPTGECNNVRHPKWGSRGAPFLRLLPPQYADSKF